MYPVDPSAWFWISGWAQWETPCRKSFSRTRFNRLLKLHKAIYDIKYEGPTNNHWSIGLNAIYNSVGHKSLSGLTYEEAENVNHELVGSMTIDDKYHIYKRQNKTIKI